MALPSFNPNPAPGSPPLSMLDIQGEFGGSAPISLSEYYSAASGIPVSGTISIRNFYGTSARKTINLNITSPVYNFDVWDQRTPSYSAGISDITVTVGSGVYVGASAIYYYAMSVPSYFTSGDTVKIVNNGGIISGAGGPGANAVLDRVPGGSGSFGGNGLLLQYPTTITNGGAIAGGGGGGGSGGGGHDDKGPARWGGSGGGGAGNTPGQGGVGQQGNGGSGDFVYGGAGAYGDESSGGAGGGIGASGTPGNNAGRPEGNPGGPGGSAGYYIVGNTYATWLATGNLFGLQG